MKSHGSHPPEWLVSSDCTLTLTDPNRSGPDSDRKQKGLLGSLLGRHTDEALLNDGHDEPAVLGVDRPVGQATAIRRGRSVLVV